MLIDGFNEACSDIVASYLKVGDESMSEIKFCIMLKGNLLHSPFIFLKPEPIGKYFKTFA